MKKQDLIDFIKGGGDDKFQKSVIEWIKSSSQNWNYFNKVKTEYVSKTDTKLELDIEKEYSYFISRRRKDKKVFFTKIAAVVTIVVLLGAGWGLGDKVLSDQNRISYEAPQQTQKKVILPDGSKVLLNSDSRLEISKNFNHNEREVRLRGEAFFEVVKEEDKPFVVKTESGISIRVLGTSFNVRSYEGDETVETTLVTGKVEIHERSKTKPSLTLAPNQKATYNKTQDQLIVDQVKTPEIISWTKGVLIFDNEPVSKVLENIERWYGVTIKVEEKEIETYSFSGKFHTKDNIKEVLELIKASSPVIYQYDNINNLITLKKSN